MHSEIVSREEAMAFKVMDACFRHKQPMWKKSGRESPESSKSCPPRGHAPSLIRYSF